MARSLENRLDMLAHEIREIKKEAILQRLKKTAATVHASRRWKAIGSRISKKWDNISATEEIARQSDKRQAIKDFDRVIQLEPKNAFNYNSRGGYYYDLGDYRKAIKDYDRAIQLWGKGDALK